MLQTMGIHFSRGPRRKNMLHPAFSFECPESLEAIFLVPDLFQLITHQVHWNGFDNVLALGVLVTSLCPFIQTPAKPRPQPGGAQQTRRIFDKSTKIRQPQMSRFN